MTKQELKKELIKFIDFLESDYINNIGLIKDTAIDKYLQTIEEPEECKHEFVHAHNIELKDGTKMIDTVVCVKCFHPFK